MSKARLNRKTLLVTGFVTLLFFSISVIPPATQLWPSGRQVIYGQTVPLPKPGTLVADLDASEHTLRSAEGDVAIVIPAGAVAKPVRLLYQPLQINEVPPRRPQGYNFGSMIFHIDIFEEAKRLDDFEFQKAATISLLLTEGDLALAGGEPGNIGIGRYDEEAGVWRVLPSTMDVPQNRLTFQVTTFSLFAVLIRAPGAASPLPTQVPDPVSTSYPEVLPSPVSSPTIEAMPAPSPEPSATPDLPSEGGEGSNKILLIGIAVLGVLGVLLLAVFLWKRTVIVRD